MRTIKSEIESLKAICDDASLSPEELALIRAERKGMIKGLEIALGIITAHSKEYLKQ